ncbi:MAG: hypothetical protein FWD93_00830, partial [Coriobacteriia bacterium]|nr:hypothetical protein [Coriobacteriia bacterium]
MSAFATGGQHQSRISTQIPADATWISDWDALRAAMADTAVAYIAFSNDIGRTGGTAAGQDLPIVQRDLTVDGNGHTIDTRNAGAATVINRNLFRAGPTGGIQRALTIKNLEIHRPNASTHPALAFVSSLAGAGSQQTTPSRNAGSFYWTFNIENVTSTAHAPAGLATISDGVLNFRGSNSWTMDASILMMQSRDINFMGGSTELLNENSGTASRIATMNPSVVARNSSLTAREGAEVTMMSRTSNQVFYVDISGRAHFEVIENSTIYLEGHGAGTGDSGGVVVINSGSGGYTVSGGSTLRVFSRSINSGQPAILQQIPGGDFIVEGEGSLLDVQSWGANNGRGATLRFRLDGDQDFHVRDGARVNIVKHQTANANDAAALRFPPRSGAHGNNFTVTGGSQVRIENFGSGRGSGPLDPGTSDARGNDSAVEYNANRFGFFISGYRSAVELIAHRGPALSAQNYSHGNIEVTNGAIFLARGITGSATASIFRASGGDVHFYMDSPLYYDFVNTRPGGGRVFYLGTNTVNTFTSLNSDVAVWRSGVNAWNVDPDRTWTLIDYHLTGANLRIASSNDPTFVDYYNTVPLHSRRMENFTRISGNNAAPEVRDMLQLTNADKYVRALG